MLLIFAAHLPPSIDNHVFLLHDVTTPKFQRASDAAAYARLMLPPLLPALPFFQPARCV
jgi:hypothetical protein